MSKKIILVILLLLFLVAPANAVKISELTDRNASTADVTADDWVPIVDSSNVATWKAKVSALRVGDEITFSTSGSLTDIQASSNPIINNYGQSSANVTVSLPQAEEGMAFTVILGTTSAGYDFRIDPYSTEIIYLDGVSSGAGKYVYVDSAAVGNAISFRTFQTGSGTWSWYASAGSGTWIAES